MSIKSVFQKYEVLRSMWDLTVVHMQGIKYFVNETNYYRET